MAKVLVCRFSSIGDVVLTSPIVRSLKTARPALELHYVTKAALAPLVVHNPHLARVHVLEDDFGRLVRQLRAERFSFLVDLHNNLRSHRLRVALGIPAAGFPKLNARKYVLTKFKRDTLPDRHLVDRYAEALQPLGVPLDAGGLELFLPPEAATAAQQQLASAGVAGGFTAHVLGAKFATKRWPAAYHAELANRRGQPVVLLGGPDVANDARTVAKRLAVPYLNTVGKADLMTSAAFIQHAAAVVTPDTGLMHVAAAFQRPTYVLWGNTVPKFGMAPYRAPHRNLEVHGLRCRPCSKLGFARCPQGHHRCMHELNPERVATLIAKDG